MPLNSEVKNTFVRGPFTIAVAEPEPDGLLDFFIADAGTDEIITSLQDGDEFTASSLGDMATFYATTDAEDVAYVTLSFEGTTSTERVDPYALFGDIEGDFNRGLDLEAGQYSLEVAAYADGGTLLESKEIVFDLI